MRTRKVTMIDQTEALIPLGKTEIQIPPLGVGAWAWGDRRIWNFGCDYNEADIRAASMPAWLLGSTFSIRLNCMATDDLKGFWAALF